MNLTRLKSGIWQVELRVPVDVRHVLGKTRFAKSTKTQDKRTAMRLAAPVLADWQQAIEQARRDPSQLISHVLNRDVDVLSAKRLNPRQDTMRWLSALRPSQAERYRLLDFSKGVPLPAFMDQFAHEHYANRRTQTEARRYILEATRFLPTFSDLTKSCAQQWVSSEESKPASHRRSAKTLQKGVGFLSEYIAWLQYKGYLAHDVENPFRNLHYSKRLARSRQYLPLTLDELKLVRMAAVNTGDQVLVNYIDIARFTGMRLSEIGDLSSRSLVQSGGVRCFRVRPDAKTEASSNRLIPIAAPLTSMVGHPAFDLRGTANAVGKRFGRLKRRVLADGDSRQKCFHSIRKFVVTTLEQANVPEGIAADLVGHEKPNITYNVYSGGSSIEQLETAVRVLEAAQVDT
jgi:integrase